MDWLRQLVNWVTRTAAQVGSVTLTGQHAAISATAIDTPTLTAGSYRVNAYGRVTRASGGTSQLGALVIGWTDGGVSCSTTMAAAQTGNTTSTTLTPASIVVNADQGSSVSYACAYASVGAPSMLFALTVSLEALP
jgi:hypothetical protein